MLYRTRPYPWYGEFFDLCDLRVSDDVMEDEDLWVNVEKFFLEWSDVEDWFVSSVAAHVLRLLGLT